jgi:hypothetical protein
MIARFAAVLNDTVRAWIGLLLCVLGMVFTISMRRRMARFPDEQRELARRYGIDAAMPIRPYDETTRRAVEEYAAKHPDARFATTSGSTGTPKRIAYTPGRLRMIKQENLSATARTAVALGGMRPVLFILSSLKEEGSLASLLTAGSAEPSWLEGLIVPTRYLAHPAIEPLIDAYGATAVRLWLMTLSDPGLIYSTNPSTLAVFLREVHDRWPDATRLVREIVRAPQTFSPAVHRVARRIAGIGAGRRLARIAAAERPLPVAEWLPGLRSFCAWDGGYVRPFLEQVRRWLPAERVAHVPMYAMSTETLMTLLVYERRQPHFLPLARGVLYEFLAEDAVGDRPEDLVPPSALESGRAYAMVVSDAFGLRRYQTDDLFLCRGAVGGLPDLVFLRRRGLAYSFTGEKLTGEQVERVFSVLRARFPALAAAQLQMTVIPSLPEGAPLPRYRLLLAHTGSTAPADIDVAGLGAAFDEAMGELNSEFAAKVRSARLAPTEALLMSYDALAARLDPRTRDAADATRRTWESQFKLVPLHRTLFEAGGNRP